MPSESDNLQERLKKEDSYYEEIGHSIWLMNDHRWALLGWDKTCKRRPAILAHRDWHWDGINDFKGQQDYERLLNSNSYRQFSAATLLAMETKLKINAQKGGHR